MSCDIKKMDIISKLHQKIVVDRVRSIYQRSGPDSPIIVELDPTAVCNLACPGCISEDLIAMKNSFSSARLLEIGKEFQHMGVKGVILIGGGEPLSHPSIGKLISYFGQNDISVGITTNGTLINRYYKEIATFSNWTRVSVDAASVEIFDALRPAKNGKSMFKRVINNMKMLAGNKKGKLGFSFLIRDEVEGDDVVSNVHEIHDAALLAKDIGCDYFEVKPSYRYKNNIAHSLVKYPPNKIEEIKIQLEKLSALNSDDFKVIKAITLDDSLNGVKTKQVKKYTTCPVADMRTLVTAFGVFVCPYWRGKEQFNIGDPKTASFNDIWHSVKRKKVMSWLNPSIHCANLHCLRHESNLEILKIIEFIKDNQEIDTVEEFDRFI